MPDGSAIDGSSWPEYGMVMSVCVFVDCVMPVALRSKSNTARTIAGPAGTFCIR